MNKLLGELTDNKPWCLAWSLGSELSGIAFECGSEHSEGAYAQNKSFSWSQRREEKIWAYVFPLNSNHFNTCPALSLCLHQIFFKFWLNIQVFKDLYLSSFLCSLKTNLLLGIWKYIQHNISIVDTSLYIFFMTKLWASGDLCPSFGVTFTILNKHKSIAHSRVSTLTNWQCEGRIQEIFIHCSNLKINCNSISIG